MVKLLFFTILTTFINSFSRNAETQNITHNHYTDTTKGSGVIFHSPRYSERFAILMRDTTLSGNRFDYRWHKVLDSNGRLSLINFQLPAFLIDSSLATSCDSMLLMNSFSKGVTWTSYPKKSFSRLIKKNIRLYMGYLDEFGNKNVVVQFISLREFTKKHWIYSNELFLVVPRKEIHFVVINLGH